MFDEAFSGALINSLRVDTPIRKPAPGLFTGMGGALSAIPRVALGETARAIEGFQNIAAPSLSAAMDAPRLEVKQAGVDFPSFSESVGREIKRLTPDPETTGTASQIVFGVGKVLAKAIPLAAVGGLPLAAAGTGLIEGTSEAQRLGDEGVDAATAAKVGAVRGVTTALGIALPVAGKTLAQTAGLVVAGGPAAFMVEQQASKMILDAADYGKIAAQYDPFDPVGLAVATLIPGIVGTTAHAVRVRAAKAAEPKPDFTPTPEQEAAARVTQTAEQVQTSALHTPGDVAGAAAHVDAIELARRQIDAGEPVSIGAVVRQVMDEESARIAAEAKPGFLRTTDDLVALKMREYPLLTPEVGRAIEIAKTPGAFRSAEDRILLQRALDPDAPPPKAAPVTPEPKAPPDVQTSRVDTLPATEAARSAEGKQPTPDPLEVSAREIARIAPDMRVVDEVTGKEMNAGQLLDEADAAYQQDTKDSGAFMAAVSCFLRH